MAPTGFARQISAGVGFRAPREALIAFAGHVEVEEGENR